MPPQASAQPRPRRSGHGGKDTPVGREIPMSASRPSAVSSASRTPSNTAGASNAAASTGEASITSARSSREKRAPRWAPSVRAVRVAAGRCSQMARQESGQVLVHDRAGMPAPGGLGFVRRNQGVFTDQGGQQLVHVEGVAEGLPVQPGGKGAHAIRVIAEPVRRNLGHGVRRQRRQRETAQLDARTGDSVQRFFQRAIRAGFPGARCPNDEQRLSRTREHQVRQQVKRGLPAPL